MASRSRGEKTACEHKVRIVTDLPPTGEEMRKSQRSWVETCRECGWRKMRTAAVQLWRQWALQTPED